MRVLAVWGGAELANFNAMVKPFTDQTGIQVQVESTRDLTQTLNTQIGGGNPPDLAGIPNPGSLIQLAGKGALKPLNNVLDMNAMNQQYDPGFLKLAAVNGTQFGIFTKASVKSLVWYDPQVWQKNGWQPPKTWQDLQTLVQKMQATGVTPWCVGLDGGAGSDWPGTDWLEDIYLHQAGPDAYDKLFPTHQTAWTDASVKQAWQTFGSVVTDPKMVYGGPTAALATNFGNAFNPMFNPGKTGCYMLHGADFMTTFFTQNFANLKAGTDYNFFVFPSQNDQYSGDLEVAGDLYCDAAVRPGHCFAGHLPVYVGMNDLLVALMYLAGYPAVAPMTMVIAQQVSSLGANWQVLTASAFISMALPLFVFFALQRYFVRGILAGSVKG